MKVRTLFTLVMVASVAVVSGTAAAAVVGSPDIDATFTDDTVAPGEETTLEVALINSGNLQTAGQGDLNQQVQTARGLTVALENESSPIDVTTGRQAVGTLGTNTPQTVSFGVSVPEDAEPGTYDVELDLEYDYTRYISEQDGSTEERDAQRTITLSVTVERTPQLSVTDIDSNVRVGSTGTVDVTVENNGSRMARDATLTMSSPSSELTFGQSGSADRHVERWETGETRTFTYRITAAENAEAAEYPFTLTGEYQRQNGQQRSIPSENVGIQLGPEQEFTVVETTHDIAVGERGTYNVTLRNDGPTSVSDATVQLSSQNGDITLGQTESGSRYVGAWAAGETRTVEFDLRASDSAQQQEYTLSAAVTYEDDEGDDETVDGLSVGLLPEPERGFTVLNTSSEVPVGDRGTYAVTLRNDRGTVHDATVRINSQSPDVRFGESQSASRYVGAWEAGEIRTVEFDATTGDDADQRSYALNASVTYEDEEGDDGIDRGLSLGLEPTPEQTFAIENVEGTLEVGDDGRVTGELVNTGPRPVENVLLKWDSDQQNLNPTETEYAVGSLGPGESARFNFSIEVSSAAESGPRQLSFVTDYDNADGDQRTSDRLSIRQQVAPESDEFDVRIVSANLSRGSSSIVEVEVTNADDERLTDISAKMFASDPISTEDDEAFIAALEPGESETITFSVTASGSALAKTYPLSMDFQYEEPDGDTVTSDTYNVPVQVTEQRDDGGGPPLLIIGGIALLAVVAIAGYFRLR